MFLHHVRSKKLHHDPGNNNNLEHFALPSCLLSEFPSTFSPSINAHPHCTTRKTGIVIGAQWHWEGWRRFAQGQGMGWGHNPWPWAACCVTSCLVLRTQQNPCWPSWSHYKPKKSQSSASQPCPSPKMPLHASPRLSWKDCSEVDRKLVGS